METGHSDAIGKSPIKIVITGPESTGKSTLTEFLANHYKTFFVPEYARTYIENLNRPYQFSDVEHIANKQIEDLSRFTPLANNILFVDTYLIITKVWFDVVYKKVPEWLDSSIRNSKIDLFLLCNTDIQWTPDPVRENGGEMREFLFQAYQKELEHYGFNYRIVGGLGDERQKVAITIVDEFLRTIIP